jgi:hypothetical protein
MRKARSHHGVHRDRLRPVSTVGQTLEQQTEALTGHTDIVSSVALSPNGMNAWRSVPKSRDKSTPST